MRAIELFAGAGGMALGIEKAGFTHELLVEKDKDAIGTLEINAKSGLFYCDALICHEDAALLDFSSYEGEVDLLAGGPPCQPFSLGGKKHGKNDDRDLFPLTSDIINEIKPKAFVLENVKGLRGITFKNYLEYIRLRLTYPGLQSESGTDWERHFKTLQEFHLSHGVRDLHYNVVIVWANAADYGIPQKRERVFIIGFRSDVNKKWFFPESTHSELELIKDKWITGDYWDRNKIAIKNRPSITSHENNRLSKVNVDFDSGLKSWKTVREAISDLPFPAKYKSRKFLNHVYHPGARIYPGHTGSELDKPAKAIKAGVNGVPGGENMIRYQDGSVRYMTIRELARFQGFPDDYVFNGSRSKIIKQLGNAVPVGMAELICKSIVKSLNGYRKNC